MTAANTSSLRELNLLRHQNCNANNKQTDTKPDYENSSDELNSTTLTNSSQGDSSSSASSIASENSHTSSCSARWTHLVKKTHVPIIKFLQFISNLSARYPRRTIAAVVVVSIVLLVVGFMTNFNLFVDENVLWTPDSYPKTHSNWVRDESGFPKDSRYLVMFFHAHGGNVLGQEQIARVFQAVDTVRDLPGYDDVCQDSSYIITPTTTTTTTTVTVETDLDAKTTTSSTKNTCRVSGVIQFWNFSSTIFHEMVSSDTDAIADMSNLKYPDETPVVANRVFGYPERDEVWGYLKSAQSYSVTISLPATEKAQNWELGAVDALQELDQQWAADDASSSSNGDDSSSSSSSSGLRVEVQAEGSFAEEFTRAIERDIPLVPMVFVVMSIFTCIVFFRRNRVYSRSLLGFAAVVAVVFSIMTGYGILFIAGVPFTSMTQLLPFIFFGIGLDDAFIIFGSYNRTDHRKDAVTRIEETVDDVALSITLTTITSATAFGLGCMSTIPAIYWFCMYTFPTIIVVLLYQLTFFVACIVLDEKRISDRRMDCLICVKVKDFDEVDQAEAQNSDAQNDDSSATEQDQDCEADLQQQEQQQHGDNESEDPKQQKIDRIMVWYAEKLLNPWVKVIVVICFTFLVGFAAYSASQFKQAFQFTDVLPSDSYLTKYVESAEQYTAASAARANTYVGVYFRDVQQSDPAVQDQMLKYVDDLVAMDSVLVPPDYFWLPHFREFVEMSGISHLAFRDQIYMFLQVPVYRNLFSDHIVLDSVGNVVESRTFIVMDNVDLEDVSQQIAALKEQRAVTRAQPTNQGRAEMAFFTYTVQYNMWEFFRVTPSELIMTTIVGVVAVTGITVLLVPHWSAVFFIFPLICVLYVDLLGVMQWAGLHINGVSYVALAMSIGLLVDYIMHILLRYYETEGNRREKTIDMLGTMGASVLVGGISTFLGTIPLVFSSTNVFYTLFIAFFGMVTLGVAHGLILLPVLLSTFGPEDQVTMSAKPSVRRQPVRRQHTMQTLESMETIPQSESD